MKKKIIITSILIQMLLLGGCGNAIPDLSDEDMHKVEEYAAGLLLKYDAGYETTVISDMEIEEERARLEERARIKQAALEKRAAEEAARQEREEAKKTEEHEGGSSAPAAPVYTDINDFFSLSDVNISFTGISVKDRYPESVSDNDWQGVVSASKGNSLAVFEFTAVGLSGGMLDMASAGAHFAVKINGDGTKGALTTLLLNDLQSCRQEIAAGESVSLVLITEVPEGTEIEKAELIMRNGSGRAVMLLK